MRPIDFFDMAAEVHEERTAVIDGDVHLSFRELRHMSEAAAGLFHRPAHEPPARVALISPNDHRVLACTLGAMRAAAVVVPVHAKDAARKKLDFLEQVHPDWVLYHSSIQADVESMTSALGHSVSWICLDRPAAGVPSLDQALGAVGAWAEDWGDAYGSPEHPVYIRQTSGTTGTPKIIVNDVGSFAATAGVLRHKLNCGDSEMVCLVAAPLSHAAGMYAFSMLTLGATLVLMRDFDAGEVLRNIPRYRVTHLWLPPTALYLLLTCPDARELDYSTLRSLVLGAAAVAPDRLREAVDVFGPCVGLNYSQIEGGFLTWLDADIVAASVAGDHPERLRSSGTSLFVSRVAIMDGDGWLLPKHETGEIVVRGRSVKPYVDEQERAAAQRFGWHHTGDLGYRDEHGYLYVVGRKKDNIITGGFKVSAAEVEEIIMGLPEIQECAVVGVPHAVRGETVVAVITVRPGMTIAASTILKHCEQRIGRGKSPRRIHQWPELPKTPVGKVDKRVIRELLEEAAAASRAPLTPRT
jgi:fatty-acyl-CoA synthase